MTPATASPSPGTTGVALSSMPGSTGLPICCAGFEVNELMDTYLKQNEAADCHLYSFDSDFDAFDRSHYQGMLDSLEPELRAHYDASSLPEQSVPDAPPPPDSPPPRALKRAKYENWEQTADRAQSVGDLASGGDPSHSRDGATPAPSGKRGRRKASKAPGAHVRSSKYHKIADGDPQRVKFIKLTIKWLKVCDTFVNRAFAVLKDASMTSTRWQSCKFPKDDMDQLRAAWETPGAMGQIVRHFLPVHYFGRPSMLLDQDGRVFCYRTAQIPFLMQRQHEFYAAVEALVGPDRFTDVWQRFTNGIRGPHFPLIMGHARQYKKKPEEVNWQTLPENRARFNNFMQSEIVQRTTEYVSRTVEIMFPGFAKRFKESAKWHADKSKGTIKPMFGLYWNLCVNGRFMGQERIHCGPHLDSKNIVGVCVLVVYQDPSIPFDHTVYSWLVLWEAGVAIQLPPWCMLIYPSSLLHHFNLDVDDFEFVMTKGERPTRLNSTPIIPGNKEGRGTLVYFNQSTMYMSSETNAGSVKKASKDKKKAHPDTLTQTFDSWYTAAFM